jgi:hypothetical protein
MSYQIDMSLKKGFAADWCMAVEGHAPDRGHKGQHEVLCRGRPPYGIGVPE